MVLYGPDLDDSNLTREEFSYGSVMGFVSNTISKRVGAWALWSALAAPGLASVAACSGASFAGDISDLRARPDAAAPIDAGEQLDASTVPDAEEQPDAPVPTDSSDLCTSPPGPSDLMIDEILVASRRGLGDDGEWVEIRNMRTCTLEIGGVVVSSPRGPSMDSVTVPAGTTLAPGARFVVASASAVTAQGLTGLVLTWPASTTDVFANGGDTVRIGRGATLLHELTYGDISNDAYGRSLSFPSDCAPTRRVDLSAWTLSTQALTPSVKGTPNRANDDVKCPAAPPRDAGPG